MKHNLTQPTGPTQKRSRIRALLSWRGLLFLLACVVTFFALFHAEENWRGGRAWRAYKHQLEAAGETFDESKMIPARVPDDENFAAIPFLRAMYDYKPGTQILRDRSGIDRVEDFEKQTREVENDFDAFDRSLKKSEPDAELSASATKVLRDLAPKMPVIEDLRIASHRPYSRYDVAYDIPEKIAILLPHLNLVRTACRFVSTRARAELVLGQVDQAFEDVLLGIYLGESIRTEPIVISELVRDACARTVLVPIKQGLKSHQWTAKQAQQLQEKSGQIDLIKGLHFSLMGEAEFFHDSFFERMKTDRTEISKLSDFGGANELARFGSAEKFFATLFVPRGWIDLEQLNYQRAFHELLLPTIDVTNQSVDPSIAKIGMTRIEAMMESLPAAIWHHRLVTLIAMPAIGKVCAKPALAQAEVNMAIVACALERYRMAKGNYPEDLKALTPEFVAQLPHDPIKGLPLKYAQVGDRYTLYSAGWNETDDGGTIVKTKGSSGNQDENQGDWVW